MGAFLAVACSNDTKESGDPYYTFDGNVDVVNVGIEGIKKTNMSPVVMRSNRCWTLKTSEEDGRWLHTFIDEGEDDGIFYYWVDPNPAFTGRNGHIDIYSNGEKVKSLEVIQAANVPMLAIVNAEGGYTALPAAGQVKIAVTSNISWTASIEAVDWAKLDSVGKDTVYVSLTKNTDDDRSLTLTCRGAGDFNGLVSTTTLNQAAPGIYLNEDFGWLQEGTGAPLYDVPEVRYSNWNDAEKAMGWTTLEGSMYGGRGYTKIGKTNVAGDLVSPALVNIKGADDVKVSFQCIGYMAGNGKKDDGVLSVGLMGPGTIVADEMNKIPIAGGTYDVAVFQITVFPDSPKNEHGEGYDPWKEAASRFHFSVKGATADTKLVFIGGPQWGGALKKIGQGKNRLYLDNIKVQAES